MKTAPQSSRQLSAEELDQVAGGQKGSPKQPTRPLEYLKVTMSELLITSR